MNEYVISNNSYELAGPIGIDIFCIGYSLSPIGYSLLITSFAISATYRLAQAEAVIHDAVKALQAAGHAVPGVLAVPKT